MSDERNGEPVADPLAGQLQALAEEVSQLRELFNRRLLEDRQRQQMYDELYRQLEFARTELSDQVIGPIVRELVLVLDRIDSLSAHVSDDTNEVLTTVQVELAEVLARRGARPVTAVGEMFDPTFHEAVDRVTVTDPAQDGVVMEERRPGYVLHDRVLRPAQVRVGSLDESLTAP